MSATAEHPLMTCGHSANSLCSSKGGTNYDPPVPACVICDCIEVATEPSLQGRFAKCAYNCGTQEPSSLNLPFFMFKGEGSRAAADTCVCGKLLEVHWPLWIATIEVARRWYKHDRSVSDSERQFHAPAETAALVAETHADFFRVQTRDEHTKVFSATVKHVTQIPSPTKCEHFTAQGPQKFDEYYCGCRGWD